jgi:hypothetical protein
LYYTPRNLQKRPKTEQAAADKLYKRVLQTYGNARKNARYIRDRYIPDGANGDYPVIAMLKAASCRPPGLVMPPGVTHDASIHLLGQRRCGMPAFCPFCLYRRLLSVHTHAKTPGPAYEMQGALEAGHKLYPLLFYIHEADYAAARDFRDRLTHRLQRTIAPPGYWTCLRPDFGSMNQDPNRRHSGPLRPPGYEVRLVLADVPGAKVIEGWKTYMTQWRKPGRAQHRRPRKSPLDSLSVALNALGRFPRGLYKIDQDAFTDRLSYLRMIPRDRKYAMFTRSCPDQWGARGLAGVSAEPGRSRDPGDSEDPGDPGEASGSMTAAA